ncbi:hypothetical protein K100096D8_22590 [Eggerthella lenta]
MSSKRAMGKKLRGSILPASSEGEVAVGFSRQSAIEVFLVRQRAIARGAIQDMASGGSKVESARSMPTKNCQAMSVKRQSTRGSPASALRHEMSREARQSAVTQRQAKGRTPWKVSGCNEHAQAPKKPRKHSEQEATTNALLLRKVLVWR